MEKITWQKAAAILAMIIISGGVITYSGLLGVLFQLKGIDYNYTGDINCGSDCESYINLTTSYWRVCFANYSDTKYENETLFKKVSRSRTLHVNLDNVNNIITTQKKVGNSWIPYNIEVDWLVPTYGYNWRPIKDGDCWERGKINKIKLVGHKNPEETIKWSFGMLNYVAIDPIWYGEPTLVVEEIFTGYEEQEEMLFDEDVNESYPTGERINVSQYVSVEMWHYDTADYSIMFPDDATCFTNQTGTKCLLNVDIEYKSDKPMKVKDFGISMDFLKKTDTLKTVTLDKDKIDSKIKDKIDDKLTLKNLKDLTYGNYTLTYEFDYETFGSDKFNISLFGVTIDPEIDGCTVITEAGIYTMNQSITDSTTSYCMNISANNVTLDCAGFTIDGNDAADYGIHVKRAAAETTNVTIKNCIITDWDTNGIELYFADGNSITNNTLTSNPDNGIRPYYSDSNTFTNITANSNIYGILSYYSDSNTFTNITTNSNTMGIYSYYSDSNTFTDVTAKDNSYSDIFYVTSRANFDCNAEFNNVIGTEDKPIMFYNSSVTIQDWNNNVSEIILCGADNSNISNLVMDRTGTENNLLMIESTQNATISDSTFIDLEFGIYLRYSDSNTFTNITSTSNTYGIRSFYSDSNTFNNITSYSNTDDGIYFYSSDSNIITNSQIYSNSDDGIYLDGNSNIINNTIIYGQSGAGDVGLYIDDDHNIIENVSIYSNDYNIYLDSTAQNNTIKDSSIYLGGLYGIYINPVSTLPNLIYNNFFNQTTNVYFYGTIYANNWNTTQQAGNNIFNSSNPNIGGNYWTNSTNNGYSDTCTDSNTDGFCDSPLNMTNMVACTSGVNCSINTDYLPLSDEYSAAGDSCTYSGSGNWDILCSDNCALVSTNLLTNNWTALGAGTATGVKNLYNYTNGIITCTNWFM